MFKTNFAIKNQQPVVKLEQKVAFTAYAIWNMDTGYTWFDISIYVHMTSCNLFHIYKHLITVELIREKKTAVTNKVKRGQFLRLVEMH